MEKVTSHIPQAVRSRLMSGSVRDIAVIIVGISLYSLAFTVFMLPHRIVIGGMAGFSTLVYYASAERIPVAVVMYGANLLLLLMGLRSLGKGFVVRTIFGATLMSLEIGLLDTYFTTHAPLIASPVMSMLMGSALMGLGIGLYYSHHGTAGGTDIVAAVMSNKSNVSMGRVMMMVDMTIVALSFFLPFDGDMEQRIQARTQTIIFGWISIFIYSYIADRYIGEGRQTAQIIVISDRWEEIARRITHETGRGVTLWDGAGYWTGQSRKLMLIWCRKYDIYSMYRIVKETDEGAYVTTSFVSSVFGNGFNVLRPKRSRKL